MLHSCVSKERGEICAGSNQAYEEHGQVRAGTSYQAEVERGLAGHAGKSLVPKC